jgi:hypothetical protein
MDLPFSGSAHPTHTRPARASDAGGQGWSRQCVNESGATSMNPKTRNRIGRLGRTGTAAAALAAITLLAAACSGRTSSNGASTASHSVPDTQQQALAYSQCVQSHGDPGFPDPHKGPGGAWVYPVSPQTQQYFSGPAFTTAQQACKTLHPNQPITPAERQAALKQLLQHSRCMRAHGITDFPDPTTNGGGASLHLGGNIDPSSPQFQAAQKACHMPGP